MTAVNPVVLRWARKRTGMSVSDVSISMKRTESEIRAWEDGTESPTYAQLEKLAYSVYKRPLSIFFFPHPPEEPAESQEFRTLPKFEIDKLSPDTRYGIREAKALQLSLLELGEDGNPSKRKIFEDIIFKKNTSAEQLAKKVRRYLGIDVNEQARWTDAESAFKTWREAIQEAGVFVFKRPFKQTEVSGFCLVDEIFPIIVVSNSTAFTRQSFTLHHELAHVLLGFSGVTTANTKFIESLKPSKKKLEVYANAFAGALLVPTNDFDNLMANQPIDKDFIAYAAHRYHVSREVILRRLLDKHLVSTEEYERTAREWSDGYTRRGSPNSGKKGGDYYATKASYLGKKYLDLAFSKYHRGHFDSTKLAEHLDIKHASLASMEDYYLQRIADR